MKSQKYQTNIIKQLDEILINQWNELWEKAENATVFNSYQWFKTCIDTHNIQNYELHVCYKNGELAAILPLCTYKHFGVKVSGTLSNNFLVDTAFLVMKRDPKLLKIFFDSIRTKRNVYLHKVDNTSAKLLQQLFPDMFFSLMSANPIVDYSTDPLTFVSQSTIKQVKKIIRKNSDQIHFTNYYGKDIEQKHLESMFTIDQNSAKKIRSMDIFSDEKNKDFYRALAKNCSKNVWICFLYYDTIPIAYNIGFLYQDICMAYQTSYLSEYGKLRPGKTMLFQLIEDLKNKNVLTLDLGGGISSYKQEFTPKHIELYNVYYSKNKLIMLWWKFINTARRKKQMLFPKKFTRDHEYLFKTLS
jgi:CelD/BcsL family acetyltransferase involved in cellulose biosynthesis